jgi:hypothetical protein
MRECEIARLITQTTNTSMKTKQESEDENEIREVRETLIILRDYFNNQTNRVYFFTHRNCMHSSFFVSVSPRININ